MDWRLKPRSTGLGHPAYIVRVDFVNVFGRAHAAPLWLIPISSPKPDGPKSDRPGLGV